jgi:phosphate uptake regulator
MAGYRRDFDETLQAIEAEVIELFAMIAEDLPRATAALLNGDGSVLPALTEHQQAVDTLYERLGDHAVIVASRVRYLAGPGPG